MGKWAVSAGTWPPPAMAHSSTRVPARQPVRYDVTVVSAPVRDESRSRGAAEVGASPQPSTRRQTSSPAAADGYGCVPFAPPVKEMVASAVPWICRTLTGRLGVHRAGSSVIAPASETIAEISAAWSQAIRYAMKPPLEWPMKATRSGSTEYADFTAPMRRCR
ncbi:hypothetical protein GCM10009682_57430 [Luedemannella flava]|uniref:Uncharacterized protein n=1 Tax=Luedemannella flava TaxID=349316 RepID=A0ABN2MLB7_9ACTN